MGCIASKWAVVDPPTSRPRFPLVDVGRRHHHKRKNHNQDQPPLTPPDTIIKSSPGKKKKNDRGSGDGNEVDEEERGGEKGGRRSSVRRFKKLKPSRSLKQLHFYHHHHHQEQQQLSPISSQFITAPTESVSAAAWPTWLTSAAAKDAIQGWVPLQADSYEKLEKVGQGTYSSVFKAREISTGKTVALKKVRFDNHRPDSVQFMAREITILRKLDHPNVMKLHGLITSRSSSSLYLVFDYMDHDLAGLISSPDVKFTEPQIKCLMKQLFDGLDYCHRQGIMHRDIKTSNILLNDEGVLKIADFGLANFIPETDKQPLTSRVVTLWYRPPELLLGSTNYGPYVDLWSVGCVFAELLAGRPILKGKTEVEQVHKIFKLCGSPPEEFWAKSKLPHSTMFKPQGRYESSLCERFKEFSEPALKLLEILLSIDPENRGTAASALTSEYFMDACEPSSLPKYPPNKELDAKLREEAQRKITGRARSSASTRMPRRTNRALPEPSNFTGLGRPVNGLKSQINRIHTHTNGGTVDSDSQMKKAGTEDEIECDLKLEVVSGAAKRESMLLGSISGFGWANKWIPTKHDWRSSVRRGEEKVNDSGDDEGDADDVEWKRSSNKKHE